MNTNKEKYGFVYIWYDRKHKRYYIGSHWGTEDDGYICSSTWMRNALKQRPQDFKRRIISRIYTNRKDVFEKEQYFLNMIKPNEIKIRYYNLRLIVGHWSEEDHKYLTTSEKISKKTKEAMARPEVREKYLKGLETRDNKSSDTEVIEKRRISMKKTMAKKFPVENRYVGPKFGSEEYKQNMSESSKKMWKNRSEEKKKEIGSKISESNKRRAKENPELTCAGKLWWNNGLINKRSKEQPDSTFVRGKLKK